MKMAVITLISVLVLVTCLCGCKKTQPQTPTESPSPNPTVSGVPASDTQSQNVDSPVQTPIDSFASKIALLQNEMNKYSTYLRPNEKSDICTSCINTVKEILLEKDSLSVSESDILGNDENFHLEFSYKTEIDGVTYRLVEFGVIRKGQIVEERGEEMGTEKVLLLQSWKENNEILGVQHIYSAIIAESITMLLDYELIKAGVYSLSTLLIKNIRLRLLLLI